MIIRDHNRPATATLKQGLGFRDTARRSNMIAAFLKKTDERAQHFRVFVGHQQRGPVVRARSARTERAVGKRITEGAWTHVERTKNDPWLATPLCSTDANV